MEKIHFSNNHNLLTDCSTKIFKTLFIPKFTSTINKIVSSSIFSTITNYSLQESTNTLKLIIDININILYLSKVSSTLLSKAINTSIVEYIYLPQILGGNNVNKSFVQNKLKFKISNENVYSDFISSDSIAINISCILNFTFPDSEYIAYILNDGFNDSLASSFSNKTDLIKNIYSSKFSIKDVKWHPLKNTILFLEYLDNTSFVSCYDFSNKTKYSVTNTQVYTNIISFTFIDSSHLIFYNKNTKNSFFYIMNINTLIYKKLPLEVSVIASHKIHYDKKSKLLYFVSFKNNNYNLCSYDLKNNYNIIFENYIIHDFAINDEIKKCAVKIINNSLEKIVLINLKDNSYIYVPLDFNYLTIQKFAFYKSCSQNSSILILLKFPCEFKLVEYNINTGLLEVIYCNKNIISFEVDTNTDSIIIILRNNHVSELVNLCSGYDNTLFKTSSFIKEVCIKTKF